MSSKKRIEALKQMLTYSNEDTTARLRTLHVLLTVMVKTIPSLKDQVSELAQVIAGTKDMDDTMDCIHTICRSELEELEQAAEGDICLMKDDGRDFDPDEYVAPATKEDLAFIADSDDDLSRVGSSDEEDSGEHDPDISAHERANRHDEHADEDELNEHAARYESIIKKEKEAKKRLLESKSRAAALAAEEEKKRKLAVANTPNPFARHPPPEFMNESELFAEPVEQKKKTPYHSRVDIATAEKHLIEKHGGRENAIKAISADFMAYHDNVEKGRVHQSESFDSLAEPPVLPPKLKAKSVRVSDEEVKALIEEDENRSVHSLDDDEEEEEYHENTKPAPPHVSGPKFSPTGLYTVGCRIHVSPKRTYQVTYCSKEKVPLLKEGGVNWPKVRWCHVSTVFGPFPRKTDVTEGYNSVLFIPNAKPVFIPIPRAVKIDEFESRGDQLTLMRRALESNNLAHGDERGEVHTHMCSAHYYDLIRRRELSKLPPEERKRKTPAASTEQKEPPKKVVKLSEKEEAKKILKFYEKNNASFDGLQEGYIEAFRDAIRSCSVATLVNVFCPAGDYWITSHKKTPGKENAAERVVEFAESWKGKALPPGQNGMKFLLQNTAFIWSPLRQEVMDALREKASD